jgi:hypothetical protein
MKTIRALSSAVLCIALPSASFALEATANISDMNSLSGFNTKLETYQALLTAALNELTHRVDVCTQAHKGYAPTASGKDANGCIDLTATTSDTVPDPTTCNAGQPLLSNGSAWTCPKTFSNPTVSGNRIYASGGNGARYCVEHGYSAVYASASGSSGCSSCGYETWGGSSWSLFAGCSGCAPYSTLTCC